MRIFLLLSQQIARARDQPHKQAKEKWSYRVHVYTD
jgi:hypothetical protein